MLQKMDKALTPRFLAKLGGRLRQAYPAQGDVTLFPFHRLFFVATKKP